MPGTDDAKRELRRRMRAIRQQEVPADRSAAIVARLTGMAELAQARTVMSFTAMPGEPDLSAFADVLAARGVTVVTPSADPSAHWPLPPEAVDAVIVPGVAFARSGGRLGRGGGWYDRFLAGVRPDCVVVGVCVDEQLVDAVPVEPHDVQVQWLVTPSARFVVGA